MGDPKTLARRLESQEYDPKDVLRALHGEQLPQHLGYPLIKLCIIHGILHSLSFAEGEAAPLRGLPEHLEFTRALNARAIMSNCIPDIDPTQPEEVPYCIWYPNVASKDTYRQLAKKCPQMRYQVARACAVAGYMDLYLELENVLPEIAVAEEARAAGSTAIFNHIMAQPVRYKVFDDYYRMLNLERPQVAHLNGDTCVLSVIESQKQMFRKPTIPDEDDIFTYFGDDGFKEMIYNITEDQGIAESVPDDTDDITPSSSASLMLDLLTSPLPVDLPAGNKDLLILTAAYYGDIDRYTRLRRPKALEDEIFCLVRGIYHNSLFALWWEHQHNPPEGEPFHMSHWTEIQKAITARHIMNNDLSRVITRMDDESLPYLIWYPEVASPYTYAALAKKVPQMREACIRAAIYANEVGLFDELMDHSDVVPNPYLAVEAKESNNPHFVSVLQSRAEDLGVSLLPTSLSSGWLPYEPWKLYSVRKSRAMMKWNWLPHHPRVGMVSGEFQEFDAVYNGIRVEATKLELILMIPESWRPQETFGLALNYKDWPPSW